MGLEVVLDEILDHGKKEEARILAEAKQAEKKLLSEAQERAASSVKQRQAEGVKRAAALEREMIGASEFEARRNLLSVRRELLGDFRARVLAALSGLEAKRNEKLLASLVARAKQQVPEGQVHARQQDMEFLIGHGYAQGNVRKGSAGGFVIESPDATILLDLRFEGLLEDVWKQIVLQAQDAFEVST